LVDRPRPAAALSYHVGGLLAEPAGATRDHLIAGVTLPPTDDVRVAPLDGRLRMLRTNRGLLVTGALTTTLVSECVRCLTPVEIPLSLTIDEEALPTIDLPSGKLLATDPDREGLWIDEHHELDLERTVREAISLAEPLAPVCRVDCPGLCTMCGAPLAGPRHDHPDDDLDPRLAALRGFVVDAEAETE